MHRVTLGTLCMMLLATTTLADPTLSPRQFDGPALTRADFNRIAAQLGLPYFWERDADQDGQIDPSELVPLVVGSLDPPSSRTLASQEPLPPAFARQYRQLVDVRRREAVLRELDSGRPTLVKTNLQKEPVPIKRMLARLLEAARRIDQLYYRQTGAHALLRRVGRADRTSRALFARNAGPWCMTPEMREDPFCNALPNFPRRRSENYPVDLEQDGAFCAQLADEPNGKDLLSPFTVVRRRGSGWTALPYHKAYAKEMGAVAATLQAAALELDAAPQERALQDYLRSAAAAFRTNGWDKADESWMRMTSDNSRWYLRVGPDEVYSDPCRKKAFFHLALARIDQRSRIWTRRLTPLRQQMEADAAQLTGNAYRARAVRLAMPEFVHVVLNAGDSRHPLGATLGQSLPNWGVVARQGRGRTVVMTNLYRDAESRRLAQEQARKLLSAGTLRHFTSNSEPHVVNTVLREASHNFGPNAGYRVRGRTAREIFGPTLATTLEQLQITCLSLRYLQLVRRAELLTDSRLREGYVQALMSAFGHLARGLKTQRGQARPHGQVAAVVLGALSEAEALVLRNGRFSLNFSILPAAIRGLTQRVLLIKAQGDVRDARNMLHHYTSPALLDQIQAARIRAEMKHFPRAHFRYALML